jgi:hypothetical protein
LAAYEVRMGMSWRLRDSGALALWKAFEERTFQSHVHSDRRVKTRRTMTSRKHPSAAFWITVALVAVLVGYPLSMGPMIYLKVNYVLPAWMDASIVGFYWPLYLTARNPKTPKPVRVALIRYAELWRWVL